MTRYLKTFLILTIFSSLSQSLTAQENLQPTRETADKLNDLAKQKLAIPDSAIIYGNRAYELSKKINYPYGLATSLKLKGILNTPKAILIRQ